MSCCLPVPNHCLNQWWLLIVRLCSIFLTAFLHRAPNLLLCVIDGILPKGPYPPCLRMADRALLAGYPRNEFQNNFFIIAATSPRGWRVKPISSLIPTYHYTNVRVSDFNRLYIFYPTRAPFTTMVSLKLSNYMYCFLWYVITHPCPNFNVAV